MKRGERDLWTVLTVASICRATLIRKQLDWTGRTCLHWFISVVLCQWSVRAAISDRLVAIKLGQQAVRQQVMRGTISQAQQDVTCDGPAGQRATGAPQLSFGFNGLETKCIQFEGVHQSCSTDTLTEALGHRAYWFSEGKRKTGST